MQNDAKTAFLEKFMEYDALAHFSEALEKLEAFEEIGAEKLGQLKIQLVEAIIFLCQIQITPFFNFIKSNDSLMKILIKEMYSGDHGLQILIGDLFKQILDDGNENKNEIQGFMYGKVLPLLIEQFNKLENRQCFVGFTQEVVELFSHCIIEHIVRMRHYIIQHKLIEQLYKGLTLKNKAVTLSIIRFVKNVVLSKDEYLIKYIISNNLLDAIFKLYYQNSTKYNLINSACLELFEKILTEKMKTLISYIAETIEDEICDYPYDKVFDMLFDAYDDNKRQEALKSKKNTPQSLPKAKNDGFEEDALKTNEMVEEGAETKEAVEEKVFVFEEVNKENLELVEHVDKILIEMKNRKAQENENNTPNVDHSAVSNQLLENEGGSVDMKSKVKQAMRSFSNKEDEDRSKPSTPDSKSSDKGNNSIKIQFTLASAETSSSESGDEKEETAEEVGGGKDKRHASQDMSAEIEAYGGDLQKKIKL